jgi:hypothetical protein
MVITLRISSLIFLKFFVWTFKNCWGPETRTNKPIEEDIRVVRKLMYRSRATNSPLLWKNIPFLWKLWNETPKHGRKHFPLQDQSTKKPVEINNFTLTRKYANQDSISYRWPLSSGKYLFLQSRRRSSHRNSHKLNVINCSSILGNPLHALKLQKLTNKNGRNLSKILITYVCRYS